MRDDRSISHPISLCLLWPLQSPDRQMERRESSEGVQDSDRSARLMEGGIEGDEWADGQISEQSKLRHMGRESRRVITECSRSLDRNGADKQTDAGRGLGGVSNHKCLMLSVQAAAIIRLSSDCPQLATWMRLM